MLNGSMNCQWRDAINRERDKRRILPILFDALIDRFKNVRFFNGNRLIFIYCGDMIKVEEWSDEDSQHVPKWARVRMVIKVTGIAIFSYNVDHGKYKIGDLYDLSNEILRLAE